MDSILLNCPKNCANFHPMTGSFIHLLMLHCFWFYRPSRTHSFWASWSTRWTRYSDPVRPHASRKTWFDAHVLSTRIHSNKEVASILWKTVPSPFCEELGPQLQCYQLVPHLRGWDQCYYTTVSLQPAEVTAIKISEIYTIALEK